jgi:HAD superfamily hydrolase (TIGR01509 family)
MKMPPKRHQATPHLSNDPPTVWPEAGIFDFDGLLADTGPCWVFAYSQTLGQSARELDGRLLESLSGLSITQAATTLGLPPEQLRQGLFDAFKHDTPTLMDGAREIVETLHQRIPLAIATNAPAQLVEETLEPAGLLRYFELIVSAEDDTHREKPAPDVYTSACHRLDAVPSTAVAFEDSPLGALAARRAGLNVVYVQSNNHHMSPDADLHVNRLDDPRLLNYLTKH